MRAIRLSLLATLALVVGCDEGTSGPLRPDAATGDAPTYYRDVAPLVQRECAGCHLEGGIAPFTLEDYESVRERADIIIDAVESGLMPPWMADPSCRSFEHERGLTSDERAVFRRWRDTGMQRGSIDDLPEPPPGPPAFEATHVARMTEPYTPDPSAPDDYRCFVLDFIPDRDLFLTGHAVVPGASSLVHHVLVYGVPPELLSRVAAADAADAGPGYTCFGGVLGGDGGTDRDFSALTLINLGAWIPGQVPHVEAEGRAIYLPAGSRIVMQVHYNLLESAPEPDRTEYHMQLSETEPEYLVQTGPLANLDLDIRAGAPEVRVAKIYRNYGAEPLRITGFTPHMHLLGKQLRADRVSAATSEAAECLIDVPRWDFDWQQSYAVRADDSITVAPGEGVQLTCVYDNSPTNQPIVNGMQVEPRDVSWGEGTLDEMCLLYFQHEQPWTGPPARGCEGTEACLADCDAGDVACLWACEGLAGGCRVCLLESTLQCARSSCVPSYLPAAACIQSCIMSYAFLGGSFER